MTLIDAIDTLATRGVTIVSDGMRRYSIADFRAEMAAAQARESGDEPRECALEGDAIVLGHMRITAVASS